MYNFCFVLFEKKQIGTIIARAKKNISISYNLSVFSLFLSTEHAIRTKTKKNRISLRKKNDSAWKYFEWPFIKWDLAISARILHIIYPMKFFEKFLHNIYVEFLLLPNKVCSLLKNFRLQPHIDYATIAIWAVNKSPAIIWSYPTAILVGSIQNKSDFECFWK